MPATTIIPTAAELDAVCRRFRVVRLRLFGSTVRGEHRPDSDVDLLVDYESGVELSLFEEIDSADALSPAFEGRQVDLAMADDVHWFIRREVVESAETIYEK